MKPTYVKYIYAFFVLTGIYFLTQKDYSTAVIELGIALAFDPFNQAQPWNERPKWQRLWLTVHLAAVASVFGLMIGMNDR